MPPAYRALAGQRLVLHGPDGVVCEATVGAPLAVRWGTVSGKTGAALRKARGRGIAEPLWTGNDDVRIWGGYAAATLADSSGPCDGALFATAPGARPGRGRVAAASADWKAAAEQRFLGSQVAALSDERVAVFGSGEPSRFTSVRRLGPAEGPSFALLYGMVDGYRAIVVERVPAGDLGAARGAVELFAASPSSVTGLDADGDGALDAVIGHPDGVALVLGRGGAVAMFRGQRERFDELGNDLRFKRTVPAKK
jgi:hypothetical protein